MNIRPATVSDIACITALERECPTAAHWSDQQYRELFGSLHGGQRLVQLAEAKENQIVPLLGFLVARHVVAEWELENIAVAPSARRTGVGKCLIEALIARAQQDNSESVHLEVRESNIPARRLYGSVGFTEAGRRKSYYANPLEDAVLYTRRL